MVGTSAFWKGQSKRMPMVTDAVAQTERALLGTVLFDNSVCPQTSELTVEDFSLDTHRRIYGRMAVMFEDQQPVDLVTLAGELGDNHVAYLSGLIDHALSENFDAYVRGFRQASGERRFEGLKEQLSKASGSELRLSLLRQMQGALTQSSSAQNWRNLFHSYDEVINAPTAKFAID